MSKYEHDTILREQANIPGNDNSGAETNDIKHDHHADAILPDSIRHMSLEERNAMEKKMVRKMDIVILPIVMILYILNFIDRQNLAAARLTGIVTELNMSTQEFATAVSILYAGYLPFQVPSNYIMSRVPRPGLYICCAVMVWGTISACTAAVQSTQGLWGVRVILGAAEAVFFPGVIYYLSAWYTKRELGKRLAALFIGQQLGNGFGGLIAAGILTIGNAHGISNWRWLFIIEGVATIGLGAIFAIIMPEYPHNARILTPAQRDLAVWRLEQEAGAGEAHEEVSHTRAFLSALRDPKVIMFIAWNICSQAMGSVGLFFPTIVNSFGFNTFTTLAITCPPYIFASFVFYGLSWWADKNGKLFIPIAICLSIGIVIYIIAMSTLNTGARYFAIMWTPVANVIPQLFLYNTIALHVPRPFPKRAAAIALVNAIGGTSNIWASYTWYAPPNFYAGFGMVMGCNIVFFALLVVYRFYIKRENRRLDGGGDQAKYAMRHGITNEQISLGWRYVGF